MVIIFYLYHLKRLTAFRIIRVIFSDDKYLHKKVKKKVDKGLIFKKVLHVH
ncbi:MAG: hypothetical protein RLZ33_2070 [Bacteroidota bacterium]|jgi:hypothetical protein